jgi:hypothetical protein
LSNLTLSVEILGEFRKLTAATKGAESQLQTMGKKAATISKSINRAFAGIGIGLSFTLLAREIGEATKAAVEDRKSQVLLAAAMQNTTNATDDQIAAAEKSISQMQMQAGVADDKLRPAYSKLFIATKDVTKSNELLALALDVSAGTGKDLDAVTQAMARSLAGSDTALNRLIPSLKGSKTPLEDLAAAFGGAAEKAANTDPYAKMQVIFGEIQERIGTALLPVLDDFAAWMSSPPGQAQLQEIADAARDILTELAAVGKWAIANKNWLLPLAASAGIFSGTVTAINGITTAVTGVTTAITILKTATGGTLLAALGALGIGAAGSAAGGYLQGKALAEQSAIYGEGGTKADPFAGLGKIGSSGFVPAPTPKVGTPAAGARGNVNITINTPKVNAQDIVNTVNNANRNGFTGTLRSLKE